MFNSSHVYYNLRSRFYSHFIDEEIGSERLCNFLEFTKLAGGEQEFEPRLADFYVHVFSNTHQYLRKLEEIFKE